MCLREDVARTDRPAHEVMAMRGDWQFRDVMICVQHSHPLVPLWQTETLRDRFDISARLQEISSDILTGKFDQALWVPSAYDLWLDRRLQDGADTTWLADHPVLVVTTVCRLLGQALSKLDGAEGGGVSCRDYSRGFDIITAGKTAIREALDQIAAMATDAQDEPSKVFGPLYTRLNRDYVNEAQFDPFRTILRECVLDHWPYASGDVILGEALPQRRRHSLRRAPFTTMRRPSL